MKSIINSKVTPEKKYPGLYTNTGEFVYLMVNKNTGILVFSPHKGDVLGTLKGWQGVDAAYLTPFTGSITLFSGD